MGGAFRVRKKTAGLEIGGSSGTLGQMASGFHSADNDTPVGLQTGVTLAPLTTLGLGGAARYLVEVDSAAAAVEAVRWARGRGLPRAVIGGGSNVVVADRGFAGLVLRVANRGIEIARSGDAAIVTAAAGESWDEVVGFAVDEKLAGLECLAGIPGAVGATPIQNVGAYGQEVSAVIDEVRVLDLETFEERTLPAAACGFGYRTSRFRARPSRHLVLEVRFRLRSGGTPTIAYEELRRVLAVTGAAPSLAVVRDAVLELRRSKSMVIDLADADSRSAGSFFINPVVDEAGLAELEHRAREVGALAEGEEVPTYPVGDGRSKVPAGWLIERAGFSKGLRRGAVGISSKHALALVHHGGGTTAQLLALANEVREGVSEHFGITLQPEPVFLGFDTPNPLER